MGPLLVCGLVTERELLSTKPLFRGGGRGGPNPPTQNHDDDVHVFLTLPCTHGVSPCDNTVVARGAPCDIDAEHGAHAHRTTWRNQAARTSCLARFGAMLRGRDEATTDVVSTSWRPASADRRGL